MNCNIEIKDLLVDRISRKFIVISSYTGKTLGFIYGWFFGGLLIGVPFTLLTAFLIRSIDQQYMS